MKYIAFIAFMNSLYCNYLTNVFHACYILQGNEVTNILYYILLYLIDYSQCLNFKQIFVF